jgi:hypothetical protein
LVGLVLPRSLSLISERRFSLVMYANIPSSRKLTTEIAGDGPLKLQQWPFRIRLSREISLLFPVPGGPTR